MAYRLGGLWAHWRAMVESRTWRFGVTVHDIPSLSHPNKIKEFFLEVPTSTLRTAVEDATPEGARIPLPPRELGSAKIYGSAIVHCPNGRFVTVVGDGEYIIYTSLA